MFTVPLPRRAGVALSLAVAVGLAGGAALAAAPAATASAPVVSISNFTFSPATVTVPVGAQVTWVNDDDVPHTVVATDKSFRSRPMDSDERYTFTFTQPGVYSYFCSLHPHMVGKVIVRRP